MSCGMKLKKSIRTSISCGLICHCPWSFSTFLISLPILLRSLLFISSVQNQAGSNWLACNSLCFLNPMRARHWTSSYPCQTTESPVLFQDHSLFLCLRPHVTKRALMKPKRSTRSCNKIGLGAEHGRIPIDVEESSYHQLFLRLGPR